MSASSIGPRCVFRVAAGPRIGFGHLLRARSLARACGQTPIVSLRGGQAAVAAARALGCRLVTRHAEMLAEADVLVVDEPSATQGRTWIRRARRAGVRSVAVHDQGIGVRHADVTIDGGAAAGRRSNHGERLAGPSFCILDPAVARARRLPRLDRRRSRPVVLISLGGGHQVRRHARALVVEIQRRCPRVVIRVTAGMAAGSLPRLPYGRWVVCRKGLSRALRAADVAVVAGGVTLYEACALGTPIVATAVVSAQRPAIAAVVRAGAALDGGYVGTAAAKSARLIAVAVASLLAHPARRRALALNGRRLIDGKGAARVAARLAEWPRARGEGRDA